MDFIGRSTWGAAHPAGFGPRPIPLDEAYLHHSVTPPPGPDLAAEYAAMRTLERIGQQRFGSGISYNLAVMPSGRVYVGTGVRRVGAHTRGRNTRALGVVLVGNFEASPVPAPALKALSDLLRFAGEEGWLKAARFTGGHRDALGANTSCPGRFAYGMLSAINAAALAPASDTIPAALIAAPGVVGTPSKGPSMLIVKAPDPDDRQFVCDAMNARHIGVPEHDLLVAAGVPLLGEEHPAANRTAFLEARGVVL